MFSTHWGCEVQMTDLNNVNETELTEEQIRQQAEALAQDALGVSAAEAWDRVRAGKYRGTLLESNLRQLMWMLGDDQLPAAAE